MIESNEVGKLCFEEKLLDTRYIHVRELKLNREIILERVWSATDIPDIPDISS